ncbi:hypothetical protein C6H68_21635 [Photorhabdus luminescens]|nr:hypothetical protein C6H68_21635 [Photorhabdus luminescens]
MMKPAENCKICFRLPAFPLHYLHLNRLSEATTALYSIWPARREITATLSPSMIRSKKLGDLYRYLTALQENGETTAASSDTILTQLQADAGRLPAPFRNMVMDMTQSAKGDTQQRAVSRIHQLASAQLSDFCRGAIAGRYPLSRHSKRDITLDDMAHMFAPNQGLMDRFFNQYLVDKVNTQGDKWHFFSLGVGQYQSRRSGTTKDIPASTVCP